MAVGMGQQHDSTMRSVARKRPVNSNTTARAKNRGQNKAPSFKGLASSSAFASRVKSRNRAKNTLPEMLLRQALFAQGGRYRLHAIDLPGRPDVVFRGARVAIFVDGDFWHGRYWRERRARLSAGANAGYWLEKIEANRARDRRHSAALRRRGWHVVRVWETDVKTEADEQAAKILRVVRAGSKRAL